MKINATLAVLAFALVSLAAPGARAGDKLAACDKASSIKRAVDHLVGGFQAGHPATAIADESPYEFKAAVVRPSGHEVGSPYWEVVRENFYSYGLEHTAEMVGALRTQELQSTKPVCRRARVWKKVEIGAAMVMDECAYQENELVKQAGYDDSVRLEQDLKELADAAGQKHYLILSLERLRNLPYLLERIRSNPVLMSVMMQCLPGQRNDAPFGQDSSRAEKPATPGSATTTPRPEPRLAPTLR